MEEVVFLVGYLMVFLWFITPAVRIVRRSSISGTKKIWWALATFLPFAFVISMAKLFQILAETYSWAKVIFNSQISIFILVIAMGAGNWIILAVHDYFYRMTKHKDSFFF